MSNYKDLLRIRRRILKMTKHSIRKNDFAGLHTFPTHPCKMGGHMGLVP